MQRLGLQMSALNRYKQCGAWAWSLILVCVLSSCGTTSTFRGELELQTKYETGSPFVDGATLYLDDAFVNYTSRFEVGVWSHVIVPLGDPLARQAELIVRSAIPNVRVVRGPEAPAGLVIRPHVTQVVRTTTGSPSIDRTIGIFIRWEVRDGRKVILRELVHGFGRGRMGRELSKSDRDLQLKLQLEQAFNEVFEQSYEALRTNPELQPIGKGG